MRINQRLLALFVVISVGFGGFFYLFFHIKQQEMRIYADSDQSQRRSTIDTIFQQRIDTQLSLLQNYSVWDEMLHYLQRRDQKWAENNLASLIQSFSYSLVQIYNRDRVLIYSHADHSISGLVDYTIEPEVLDSLLIQKKVFYYTRYGSVLLANAAAGIYPSSDPERLGEPQGTVS